MRHGTILIGAALSLISASAAAAIVTQTFDINASSFVRISGFPDVPPVNPVHLNFTVTFDNSVDINAPGAGLVINSFNMSAGSAYAYSSSRDEFYIGSSYISPNGCNIDVLSGYCAEISTKGVPKFGFFAQNTGVGIFNAQTGSVTTTAGAVPEPATWALMIGGFALVGGVMRRRNMSVTA